MFSKIQPGQLSTFQRILMFLGFHGRKGKTGKILLGSLHVCGLGSFWDPCTCGLGSCGNPCTCGLGSCWDPVWIPARVGWESFWDRFGILFGIVPRVVWDCGRSLRRWGLGSFWDPYMGDLRSFEGPFQMFRGAGSESDPKTIRKRAENTPKTIRKRSPQVAGELGKEQMAIH